MCEEKIMLLSVKFSKMKSITHTLRLSPALRERLKSGSMRPRRDAGLPDKRLPGKRKGKLKEKGECMCVASSTYFEILPPFPANNHSVVTLSGPDLSMWLLCERKKFYPYKEPH